MQFVSASEAFTGYSFGNEEDQLIETASAFLAKNVANDTIPSEFDPRQFHKIEDQMRQGSCQGHALSSVGEACYWFQTGSKDLELSRNFAYRASQLEDNIRGDQGSTISGGAACFKKGICREEFFPYTETYARRIPKEAFENREEFKIRFAQKLIGPYKAEQVINWIGSAKGGIVIGIKWTADCDADIITRYNYRNRGGGHAVAVLGYTKRTLILANSWGTRFSDDGYQEIEMQVFDDMLSHQYNVAVMYSDLEDVETSRELPDLSIIGEICK